VAFGSCNLHEKKLFEPWTWMASQSYWKNIDRYFRSRPGSGYPDVWIWAGDIVYANTRDEEDLNNAYRKLKDSDHYKTFVEKCGKSNCDIVGVWDDHDFGENNLVGESRDQTPFKELTKPMRKAALLKFLGEPTASKVAGREQIYAAHDYQREDIAIRIILLDLRYNRQDKGKNSRIMDDKQWDWLESKLTQDGVDLHFIVSSTQVLRTDGEKESWGQYPKERDRLLSLIGRSRSQGVMLLTGDIHAAEISRFDPEVEEKNYGIEFPLYEITASGLNRLKCRWFRTCGYVWDNEHREGFVREKNFGEIDVLRSADGTLKLLATLRSSHSPETEVLLRKRIEFAPRHN
jgi:alkaline phosphatase D